MLLRRFWWLLSLMLIFSWPPSRISIAQTSNNIRIWWPEALYDEPSRTTIDALFTNYNAASNTQIESRIYLMNFQGMNVVSQLQLVNTVAPSALPDIVLIRRDDMNTILQQASLTSANADPTVYTQRPVELQPLTVWDTISITNELSALSPTLVSMGEINGIRYGLPYLIEVQHVLYEPTAFDEAPQTAQDLLAAGEPILFTARPNTGQAVNDFLLTLYVSAGGTFINSEGIPILDEVPLRQTLIFIEEATASQIISVDLLNYRQPEEYLDLLVEGERNFAFVNSSLYLTHEELTRFTVEAVPTLDTEPSVLLDGWVWVLLTDDPERQAAAFQFVRWMYETDQMVDVALAVHSIPVQERALNAMDDPYYESIQNLIGNAILVRGRRNPAAVALQNAFEAVLNGASSTEAATTALNSLSSSTTDS